MVLLAIYLIGAVLTIIVVLCALSRIWKNDAEGEESYMMIDKIAISIVIAVFAGICWVPLGFFVLRFLISVKKEK